MEGLDPFRSFHSNDANTQPESRTNRTPASKCPGSDKPPCSVGLEARLAVHHLAEQNVQSKQNGQSKKNENQQNKLLIHFCSGPHHFQAQGFAPLKWHFAESKFSVEDPAVVRELTGWLHMENRLLQWILICHTCQCLVGIDMPHIVNSSPSQRPWVCTQLSSPHAEGPEENVPNMNLAKQHSSTQWLA